MDHPADQPSTIFVTQPTLIYKRQETLSLYVPGRAIVIGVGGTGSWVALFLALTGVDELTLIDPDTVEAHNLNRLPLPADSIGRLKVEALADEIVRYRPMARVVPLPLRYRPGLVPFNRNPVVFDCTDSNATQDEIEQATKDEGADYFRAGCEAGSITATRRRPAWGQSETEPGYGPQGVPVWVGPAVLAAVRSMGLAVAEWPEVSGEIRKGA